MARILTGIQSTGIPHLGNILGAIKPAIRMADEGDNEAFFFIADLHSLTTIKDRDERRRNILGVAAAWLAFGFDTSRHVLYRQSAIPEVTELTWYLNCFTPYPMLANAHSFKDKSDNPANVTGGLFTYPVLMAADIMLYDAHRVPVGKDQIQHLEMTRDIGNSFNHLMGETLVIPEVKLQEDTMYVPGTDGRKMSKSYGNTINIFEKEKALRKSVMSIVTDSKGLEEPKDPDTCNVFAMYRLLATEDQASDMAAKYRGGNYGYGHAKQELFELILDTFGKERERYAALMANPEDIDAELERGAEKARVVARSVLGRVREKLGY